MWQSVWCVVHQPGAPDGAPEVLRYHLEDAPHSYHRRRGRRGVERDYPIAREQPGGESIPEVGVAVPPERAEVEREHAKSHRGRRAVDEPPRLPDPPGQRTVIVQSSREGLLKPFGNHRQTRALLNGRQTRQEERGRETGHRCGMPSTLR